MTCIRQKRQCSVNLNINKIVIKAQGIIFILDEYGHVDVYNNLKAVTAYIEWQDIFECQQLLFDSNGKCYKWGSLKYNEIGTVYNYTLVTSSEKSELISIVINKYNSMEQP